MPDLIGHLSLFCHARLDRASVVLESWIPAFAGMTEGGGYDSSVVMPDLIGHPFRICIAFNGLALTRHSPVIGQLTTTFCLGSRA